MSKTEKKPTKQESPKPTQPVQAGRASFLPQTEPEPPAHEVTVEAPAPPDETPVPTSAKSAVPLVTLRIHRVDPRTIEIILTIPPLAPCKERKLLPIEYTPEILASLVGDMIERAGQSARRDGEYQYYRKQQEDAEARARIDPRSMIHTR